MEDRPTVGHRSINSRTELDRQADQLQAEAYQHLARRLGALLSQEIDLDPLAVAHKEVTQ